MLSSCPPDGIVLDPFGGSCTVAEAVELVNILGKAVKDREIGLGMTDTVTPEKRSEIMRHIRSPSQLERKALPMLVRMYGAAVQPQPKLPGLTRNPDYYDEKSNTAIWIQGCFWHGCQQHFKVPKTRTEYWQTKIAANLSRDWFAWLEALDKGYRVHVIWEHSIK